MINKYDFHKLLDDLKRISRLIRILKNTEDKKTREDLSTVVFDELQRLTEDLEEIRKNNSKSEVTYTTKKINCQYKEEDN